MQRAVDGDNVTLCQHLFEVLDTAASDLLFDLWLEWLVIVVEELLAVERLQTAEYTFTNSAYCNGSDDLAFEIEFVLGYGSHVPVSRGDLLVCGDEVADKGQNGHHNVFGHGYDIAAGHLSDGDTAVSLIGRIEVNVVRAYTSGDGELEVLGLGQSLSSEVPRVESTQAVSDGHIGYQWGSPSSR